MEHNGACHRSKVSLLLASDYDGSGVPAVAPRLSQLTAWIIWSYFSGPNDSQVGLARSNLDFS